MNTEAKTALYIGRFQPFHNGHKDAIEQIAQAPDVIKIIIGIGSAQFHHYLDNPFTAEEREEMVRRSLRIDKPYEVIPVIDIHDFPKWVPFVESICPKFDVLYSGNTLVKRLFSEKGYEVRDLNFNFIHSGTDIRVMMFDEGPWQNFVPEGTVKVIEDEKVKGVERLLSLHNRHIRFAVTADIILQNADGRFVFIRRRNEPYKSMVALPGGYVEPGKETTMQAAIREAREEIGVEVIDPWFLGVYDRPQRDPREPCITHVFYATKYSGVLKAGDDAASLVLLQRDEIKEPLAFDHIEIIDDYLKMREAR